MSANSELSAPGQSTVDIDLLRMEATIKRVRDAVKDVPTYIRGKGWDQAKTLAHYRRDVLAAIDTQLNLAKELHTTPPETL